MDKIIEQARELIVNPSYDLKFYQCKDIISLSKEISVEGSSDVIYNVVSLAFKVGFIKGDRAAKAEYKKKQKKAAKKDLSKHNQLRGQIEEIINQMDNRKLELVLGFIEVYVK